MDLKKDYDTIYQHWLKEYNGIELTKLTEATFKIYKHKLKEFSNLDIKESEVIKVQILEKYKGNYEYLFNDLLLIREIKIINKALILEELEFDKVIKPEKLLYQNVVSGIKGYDKMKSLSFFDDTSEIESDIVESTIKPELEDNELNETESIQEASSIVQKDGASEILKVDTFSLKEGESTMLKTKENQDINYVLVRFIKQTPPLVGVDLINYGPFREQDIANLPEKNANILILEKFAEKINLS
ncbi:MAG: hypothetical protein P8Y70_11925 [Candidatus Lokiarchaeota archaeon]